MVAIFNEKTLPDKFSTLESKRLFDVFIKICDLFYQACKSTGKGYRFVIYINKSFYEHPLVKDWYSKYSNSKNLHFLINILKHQHFDDNCNLVVSLSSSQEYIKTKIQYNGKEYFNASEIEHFYIHLSRIPKWNAFPFKDWMPDFDSEEKLLPVAKLSDYFWLKFIENKCTWDNNVQRGVYWKEFVEKIRHISSGGEKETVIIDLFTKITKINGFVSAKVCKRQNRKIMKYPYKSLYYLSPDMETGALEVYNFKQVHQGEWTFYGKRNLNKKADKNRNICN